jgi:plastocyanin
LLSRASSPRRARRSVSRTRLTVLVCLLGALGACACDGANGPRPAHEREPTREEDGLPPEPAYREIEVEEAGSIAGVLSWAGERPEIQELLVRNDADECGPQRSQALRISAGNGVADAVVSLMDVREGVAMEAPSAPPEIQHRSCRFEPHVLAVSVGTPIVFVSEDSVIHNVHATRDERTIWDFAQPERGARARRTVDEPGIIRIVCDVHAWTEGWIHVFPHPYFAVTDEEGRYRLAGVPTGQYVVRVWHEGWRLLGTASGRPRYSSPIVLTRTVSVSPREETSVDFEMGRQSAEAAGD